MARHESKGPQIAAERRKVTAFLEKLESDKAELGRQISELQSEYRRTHEAISALRAVLEPATSARLFSSAVLRKAAVGPTNAMKRRREAREEAQKLVAELAPTQIALNAIEHQVLSLRPGSLPFQARSVLLAAGEPLRAEVLAERMEAFGRPPNRDSLVTALARLAGADRVFFRVPGEPNTFGLMEWHQQHGDALPKADHITPARRPRKSK